MGKHTPGPWKAGRSDMATIVDGFDSKWVYSSANGVGENLKYVAIASGFEVEDWEEVMANARLIAASPSLLEALKNILSFYPYTHLDPDTPEGCAYQQAKAAIDKAEGHENE